MKKKTILKGGEIPEPIDTAARNMLYGTQTLRQNRSDGPVSQHIPLIRAASKPVTTKMHEITTMIALHLDITRNHSLPMGISLKCIEQNLALSVWGLPTVQQAAQVTTHTTPIPIKLCQIVMTHQYGAKIHMARAKRLSTAVQISGRYASPGDRVRTRRARTPVKPYDHHIRDAQVSHPEVHLLPLHIQRVLMGECRTVIMAMVTPASMQRMRILVNFTGRPVAKIIQSTSQGNRYTRTIHALLLFLWIGPLRAHLLFRATHTRNGLQSRTGIGGQTPVSSPTSVQFK